MENRGWTDERAQDAATDGSEPRDRARDREAVLLGGLAGGLGQTLLDALMHADLRPFWPVAGANPWLGTVDLGVLHSACLAAGAAGLVVLGVRQWRRA